MPHATHYIEQFASYEWLKNQTKGFRASGTEQVTYETSVSLFLHPTSEHTNKYLVLFVTAFSHLVCTSVERSQPAWVSVVIGAAAKIFASTLTYPYQVVKSRLQQRDPVVSVPVSVSIPVSEKHLSGLEGGSGLAHEVAQPRYTGTLDCVLKVWR